MKKACSILGAYFTFLAAPVQAQECWVHGEQQQHRTTVTSPDGSFEVRAFASEWHAQLNGDVAHFQARGVLSFSSASRLRDVELRFRGPSVVGGILFVQDPECVEVRGVAARDANLQARIQMGSVRVLARLSCDSLSLVGSADPSPAHPPTTALSDACSTGEVIQTVQRVDGDTVRAFHGPAGRQHLWRPRQTCFWLHRRPRDRRRRLRIEAQPASWREVEVRGTWLKIRQAQEHAVLEGWVHRSNVVRTDEPLYASGRGFRARAGRVPRNRAGSVAAVIRVGAPVYSAAEVAQPWAFVAMEQTLFVTLRGRWAEIQDSRLVGTHGHAWARAEDVLLDRIARRGMSAILTRSGGAIVTAVRPGSPASRLGLQVGDELRGRTYFNSGARVSPLPYRVTVLRAHRFVELSRDSP